MQRIKQVILIRKDLKMRRGKEIAQGSHASMAFLLEKIRYCINQGSEICLDISETEQQWLMAGSAKICLRVNSEQELLHYHHQALQAGLVSGLIKDSGKTEFSGIETLTACAIGPDDAGKIDLITAELTPY